jgi:SAM-dependent methyltransferase
MELTGGKMSAERDTIQHGQVWEGGDAYERYVGRWSRLVARQFVAWLARPAGERWLDVGCGTGALSRVVLETASPSELFGVDRSEGFIAHARSQTSDTRARFEAGNADALTFAPARFDVSVSGLVLNFVPRPDAMLSEMGRVARAGGLVAIYVWDYAGEMQLIRYFFDAAAALDSSARVLDEGRRFPICKPEPLHALFEAAGLRNVQTRRIDVPTVFRDFGDYWSPFLGGQGPAPSYALSLDEKHRALLREYLRGHLPTQPDGSIHLIARAWAVRGEVP